MEVAGHAAAQVLRLAHIDDFAFGILVEIDAGLGRDSADFGEEVHCGEDGFILLDDLMETFASGSDQPWDGFERRKAVKSDEKSGP